MSNSNIDTPVWYDFTGKIPINLTNDYLFRALMQENNNSLKGLVSALLNMDINNINEVTITNPIVLGESINDKTFILDIRAALNNAAIINIELQVINEKNWPNRSLSYLCRTFDQLKSGSDYNAVKPVYQIGLLNYTLFPEAPEFYSTYKLLNIKSGKKYSDMLTISVLDLTRIDLATECDKVCKLDQWARLFTAKEWSDVQMLANENEIIKDSVSTLYQLSEDEKIRQQMEAREDYYRRYGWMEDQLAEYVKQVDEYKGQISEYQGQISDYQAQIVELQNKLKKFESDSKK